MATELRITDTNAASDSQGRTWGLEGNLFWWLVGGVGGGITFFFVLLVGFKVSLFPALGSALIPVLISLIYIFGLRHGKPPGYDRDWIEHLLRNPALTPDNSHRLQHPLS